MQTGNTVDECLRSVDKSNETRAVRQFLACIGDLVVKKFQDKVKKIVVDNGAKYHYVLYLEVYSKDVLGEIVNMIKDGITKLGELDPRLGEYVGNMKICDWGEEKYIMLSKEYVIVKYVLR